MNVIFFFLILKTLWYFALFKGLKRKGKNEKVVERLTVNDIYFQVYAKGD